MRGARPCNPMQLWKRRSPTWQTRIRADLTALFQEMIDAQLRADATPTSGPQGRHGHPAINPPHQVVSHPESLRLQYALHERARQLGWPDEAIDIMDDDLG